MITSKKTDGTYGEIGFIKAKQDDGSYKDIEYQYDNKGNLIFEKGFTRSKEGALPLVINGIGKPLKDYDIESNISQATTPTVDNPQEVVGVGDRTGNLFSFPETKEDGSSVLIKRNEGESNFFITKNNDNNAKRELPINMVLKAGTYTLSVKGFSNSNDFIYFTNSDGANIGYYATLSSPKTFTLTEETVISNICCYVLSDSKYENTEVCVMLNSGSTPHPYEPYGYKLDVECRGKNLYSWDGNLLGSSSLIVSSNKDVISSVVDVRGTNTLYFTGDNTLLNSGVYRISKSDTPIEVGSTIKTYDASFSGGVYDVSDCNYLLITASVYAMPQENREIIKSTFMLNTGTTPEPYEPYTPPITTPIYLDSPLYKIGDYSDSRGMTEEVRVVKELVLTGEENFQKNDVIINSHAFALYGFNIPYISEIGLCTHLTNSTSSGTTGNSIYFGKRINLCFDLNSEITTDAALKAWLKAQYAAGTPVTVYYVLATPEARAVEPVEIPTLNGNTVIDVDTEVKPSNMWIKYKSSTSEYNPVALRTADSNTIQTADGENLMTRS